MPDHSVYIPCRQEANCVAFDLTRFGVSEGKNKGGQGSAAAMISVGSTGHIYAGESEKMLMN